MEQLQGMTPGLAFVGAVLGIGSAVAFGVLFYRFQRFARPYEELARAVEKEGAATALATQLLGVERNSERIDAMRAYAEQIETQLHLAIQGIGFLKYDAFEDIRGQQSYSLCLLDAHRNGVIVSSIAGRNDCRGYAKPVKEGRCDLAMSDEEKQALDMALASLSSNPVAPNRPRTAAASKTAAPQPAEPATV
jgi:hypothetical protein